MMAKLSVTNYSGSIVNISRSETFVIINCVLNAPLIPTSIVGNALVLIAIMRTPSLRSPPIILLCSLAMSDLLVGILVQPLYIANELMSNSSQLKAVTYTMAFSACGVSLLTITAISVDRFLALHYHMRYHHIMSTNRAMYTSLALWSIGFLESFLKTRPSTKPFMLK